jgi:uncharacterized protein (TIGR04222 family)
MDGPTFLLVYALVAIAVIMVAYNMVRARDKTVSGEPPRVPATFDPYEIAYLRGGKYAVIRTAIYALYHRGLVEVIPGKWLKGAKLVAKKDLRGRELNALEERVLRSAGSPVEPDKLFQNELTRDVETLCEPFRTRLESEQLFRSDADRSSARTIPLVATAVLVVLALYRILPALDSGRPVGFLFVLTFLSVCALWIIAGGPAIKLTSDRGRAYLKRIQDAYRGANMSTVAMVGLFGIGILSETQDAEFAKLFPKGGSSGDGGSGCGSGGCGSGCGGGGCGGGD